MPITSLRTLTTKSFNILSIIGTSLRELGAPLTKAIFLAGFIAAVLAFFPGWMTVDSFFQYEDAISGSYRDWCPILMSWWWRKLDFIYRGPALLLIQNLLFYWCSFLLIYLAARKQIGKWAFFISLIGFWPGLFYSQGEIWKDVMYAVLTTFVLAAVFYRAQRDKAYSPFVNGALIFCLVLSYGVKTNGATVLPVIFFYWVSVEFGSFSLREKMATSILGTASIIFLASLISLSVKVTKCHVFQYNEVHDLVALSIHANKVLLPPYIQARTHVSVDDLKSFYTPDINDRFFFSTFGSLRTFNQADHVQLDRAWKDAVLHAPLAYLKHRALVGLGLLRIGRARSRSLGYIGPPDILPNEFGFRFQPNTFSEILGKLPEAHHWIFFPSSYCALLLIELLSFRLFISEFRSFALTLNLAAWAFIGPHFFIAPAYHFRYLYFSYFCAVIQFALLVGSLGVLLEAKIRLKFPNWTSISAVRQPLPIVQPSIDCQDLASDKVRG